MDQQEMARGAELFGSCFSPREHKSHKGLGLASFLKHKLCNVYAAAGWLWCCNSRLIILQLNFQEQLSAKHYVILGDWTRVRKINTPLNAKFSSVLTLYSIPTCLSIPQHILIKKKKIQQKTTTLLSN